MSEYAQINIGKFELWAFRNEIDSKLMNLFFTGGDLLTYENVKEDERDEDEIPHSKYVFQTNVKKVKNRFDALGYSLSHAKCLIEANDFECLDYNDYLSKLGVEVDDWEETAKKRIKKYVTFKKFENSLKRRIAYEIESDGDYVFNDCFKPKTECDKIIYYAMHDYGYYDSYYGLLFDLIDPVYIFRIILEFFPENEVIECDVTPLIGWTYNSIGDIKIDGVKNKIVVLVEGTSDKDILEYALYNLYPHLFDIFYFMDFEYANSVKRQGGVDSITNLVKAFIMAKLDNKFIALFDNDTVGCFAKDKLLHDIRPIPSNIKILSYPDLSIFNKYPTISPNGKLVLDNINKKACSIELYLPEELISYDGTLLPIEWESRITIKIGGVTKQSYQGVIAKKDMIKQHFFDYKKKTFCEDDWGKIKKLIDSFIYSYK